MDSPAPDGKESFLTAPMIAALAVSTLLLALKPFLRKERQEKIDRALHAARLASLASLALKNRGRGPGAKETP